MIIADAYLQSKTPYSQSAYIDPAKWPKKPRESDPDYEARIWRERCNYREDGHIVIPPMAFANSLKEAAKYLSIPVPGKGGKSTYTKNFESSVMVLQPLVLPAMKDSIKGETFFVPSNGVRGNGKRVTRTFPVIPEWSGVVQYIIGDPIITKDIFEKVLKASGLLIGIGRFRPRNWGYYGQFTCTRLDWQEDM